MLYDQPRKTNVIHQARLPEGKSVILQHGFNNLSRRWYKKCENRRYAWRYDDELSGKGITNFASTGPKSYGFKYGDNDQNEQLKVSHLTMKTAVS